MKHLINITQYSIEDSLNDSNINVDDFGESTTNYNLDKVANIQELIQKNILSIESEVEQLLKVLSENRYNTKLTIILQSAMRQLKNELLSELDRNSNI